MSSTDENTLVERVFLRIGSAETDEQLESCLSRFLTPLLLKLDSKEEGVRKKVMELLVHINKRLKSRTVIQLPVDDLIQLYKDPAASSMVTNFTVIYIKMVFPRLNPKEQAERVPAVIGCLEGRSPNHQDNLLQLVMPALAELKFPQSMDQCKEKFSFVNNSDLTKMLLDYMLDLLTVPYGSHTKITELQAVQTRRPATAPAGDGAAAPTASPGLSIASIRREMGDNPYQPELFEKDKLGIIKFLGSDIFPESDVVCHYIIGAADTRHRFYWPHLASNVTC